MVDSNSNEVSQVDQGLKEMREWYQEFQKKGEASKDVSQFLENSFQDEALLRRFLVGRKYRAKHACETLKTYGEMRFDKYPDMFPAYVPEKECFLVEDEEENPIFGVLKERDSKGRRIVYFNASKWDTDKHSMKDMTMATLPTFERLLLDEDCMKNGMVGVQECSEMWMNHVKQYSLEAMLRLINLYWYSYPIKLKGVYFVNVPYFFSILYGVIKPFLPKKLKERLLITSRSIKFEDLHKRISPDILPKHLGGRLEMKDAVDQGLLGFKL